MVIAFLYRLRNLFRGFTSLKPLNDDGQELKHVKPQRLGVPFLHKEFSEEEGCLTTKECNILLWMHADRPPGRFMVYAAKPTTHAKDFIFKILYSTNP
jgi:hypothetical protein